MMPFISSVIESFPSKDEIKLWWYRFNCRRKFREKDRVDVWKQLLSYLSVGKGVTESLMLIGLNDADLPIDLPRDEAISRMAATAKSPIAQTMAKWVRSILNDTESFAQAARDEILEFEYLLLYASEESETSNCLEAIIKLNRANTIIKKTIRRQLIYPIFLLGSAIGMIFLFGIFVEPMILKQVPYDLISIYAKVLCFFSDIVYHNTMLSGIFFFVFLVWVFWSLPNWTSKAREKFENIPPWSIYRMYQGSAFLMILSGMLSVGRGSDEAVRLLLREGNPYIQQRMRAIRNEYRETTKISAAMVRSGFIFPDRKLSKTLRAFEDSGTLTTYLTEKSDDWIADSVERIEIQMGHVRSLLQALVSLLFILMMAAQYEIGDDVTRFTTIYHGQYKGW